MRALTTLAALAAAAVAGVHAAGLVDDPIAADWVSYLDSPEWVATAPSAGLEIRGAVPGDLITDLQMAGLIGASLGGEEGMGG
jgi:hypothetical protein